MNKWKQIIGISLVIGLLFAYSIVAGTITHVGEITGAGSPNYLSGAHSVFVSGNYAYVASYDDDALSIFDISDPTTPIHVGEITGAGSPNYLNGAYGIYVSGNYAYVAAFLDDALSIFDISDPTTPTLEASIQGAGSPNYLDGARSVFVSGDYAYVVTYPDNALSIFDISTPSSPSHIGTITGAGSPNYLSDAYDIHVHGNYAYVASFTDDALSIFDISDPTIPTLEASIQGAGSPNYLDGARSVFVSGDYAYVVATDVFPSNNDGLTIFDVSDFMNNAPTITFTGEVNYESDGVHPDSDMVNITYTFRVKYTDADNDPPSSMQTWLDESKDDSYGSTEKHDMTEVDASDTDYTDGKLYEFTYIIHPAGTMKYKFMGNDGTDTAYSTEKTVTTQKGGPGPGPSEPTETPKPPEPTTTPPKTSPSIIPPDVKTDLMIIVVIFMMITLGVVAARRKK